ncbi:MAG: hypothetical protein SFV52_11625 [Saprospiraceae bacterium]|nr:hypothetical protein [Saprospiraceae bacterium]
MLFTDRVDAQSILHTIGSPPNEIGRLDLVNCTYTPLVTGLSVGNFVDFVLMPDGFFYLLGFSGNPPSPAILRLDPVTGNTTVLGNFPPPAQASALFPLNDSTLLVHTPGNFYTFNLITNTSTFVGAQPGFNGFGEIIEYNGQLLVSENPSGDLYAIDLGPPFSLTFFLDVPVAPLVSVCNNVFGPSLGSDTPAEINMANGTTNTLCPDYFLSSSGGFLSLASDPFNDTGPLCNCVSESGTFQPTPTINVCDGVPIALPHNGDETLDGDDNLIFALVDGNIFTNYPGNVIYQYTTPFATFIPGVTEYDVTYRVYAVAANALGSGVDFLDPCREISTPIAIRWRPSPTVALSSSNNCTSDCVMIDAAFTGTPPFSLTYQVSVGGTTESFTQTFSTQTGSFEVCPPPGFTGQLDVAATALDDAFCNCQ